MVKGQTPAELDEPEFDEAELDEAEPQPELTPMGNRRSPVTESDDIEYTLPSAFLKRASGAQKLDTKGMERVGRRSWRRSATSTSRRASSGPWAGRT